jgi:hypothetical protein
VDVCNIFKQSPVIYWDLSCTKQELVSCPSQNLTISAVRSGAGPRPAVASEAALSGCCGQEWLTHELIVNA